MCSARWRRHRLTSLRAAQMTGIACPAAVRARIRPQKQRCHPASLTSRILHVHNHCRRAVSQAVDTPLSHAEAAEPPADGREHSAACTAGCQQDGPVTDAAEAAADTKDASAAGWAWASRRRRHRKDAKAEACGCKPGRGRQRSARCAIISATSLLLADAMPLQKVQIQAPSRVCEITRQWKQSQGSLALHFAMAEASVACSGMQQRAAMLAHQVAVDRAARAFYGSARDGLQHDAACALRSANAALERCHDIEPSLDIVWELKGVRHSNLARLYHRNIRTCKLQGRGTG